MEMHALNISITMEPKWLFKDNMRAKKKVSIVFLAALVLLLVPTIDAAVIDSFDGGKGFPIWPGCIGCPATGRDCCMGQTGQCFTLSSTTSISGADVYLKRNSDTTGNFLIRIFGSQRTVGSNACRTGTEYMTDVLDSADVSIDGDWVHADFSGMLSAGDYCLHVDWYNPNLQGNMFAAMGNGHAGNAYGGGNCDSTYDNYDMNFYLYGEDCTCTPGDQRCDGDVMEECDDDCMTWYAPDGGCCQHSKCCPGGSCESTEADYCTTGYACSTLSQCYERTGTDRGQDPQESNEDFRGQCGGGTCNTGNCAGGSSSCGVYSTGQEGVCATCYTCNDGDSACDPVADNTRDSTGSNTCTGTCKTCNGAGSCVNQDANEDLFNQCGAIECDGGAGTPYYWGWSSKTCYYRTDVAAGSANCNGAGACKTAADYCPSQGQGGSTGTTCDCEEAQQGCSGTMVGSCDNGQCSSCTYGGSGDWNVECSDNCVISSNVNLGENNLIFSGSGTFSLNADLTNWNQIQISSGCRIEISDGNMFG